MDSFKYHQQIKLHLNHKIAIFLLVALEKFSILSAYNINKKNRFYDVMWIKCVDIFMACQKSI